MRAQQRTTLQGWARLAMAEASSGRALTAKLRALCRLVEAGKDSPLSRKRLRAELQSIVKTELVGGRTLEAAVRAVDQLDALDGRKDPGPDVAKPTEPERLLQASWDALDQGDVERSHRLHTQWRELTGWRPPARR